MAILHNHLPIVKYYLEELMLNPLIFLVKPMTNEENQVTLFIRKSALGKAQKEYSRY